MKRFVIFISVLALAIVAMAQAPQKMNFQALIRDASGELVKNRQLTVTMNVMDASNTVAYSEQQTIVTNNNGLVTMVIGEGVPLTGSFSEIDWSVGTYYLQTCVDLGGGVSVYSSISPLLSVPYAFYAEKAGTAEIDLNDYVKKSNVPEPLNMKRYALKSEIPAEVDLTDYAKKNEIPEPTDLSNNVLMSEIPTEDDITNCVELSDVIEMISDYASKSELPATVDLSIYAKKSDIPEPIDLSNYVMKSDVSTMYKKSDVDALISQLHKDLIIKDGAIQAAFSVSSTKKVYFSIGNLQYQASKGIWRFAEEQWYYVGDKYHQGSLKGSDNTMVSATYDGWIDLFGWGTSGYKGKAPYMTSTEDSDYGNGGNNIAGTNYDWGVYNKISNGGNIEGVWRTLTSSEWEYLLSRNSGQLYGKGCVNGVNGLILLPDGWSQPSSLNFTSKASDWTTNKYSLSDWNVMQLHGAVFLPAGGERVSTSSVSNTGKVCRYWSVSRCSSYQADYLTCGSSSSTVSNMIQECGYRSHAKSVRLVQDVK